MARILIIDDDKSFREALAESVRDFGHDVVEARGAKEAFKLIGNVDAAFLDLKMPGMSGIEFLREIKSTAPVIVLTAFADSSNTIEAIKLGAFDHLTKPIGRSDLQRVLAEALKNPEITPGGDSPPVLQDRVVTPIGGQSSYQVNIRILAATHQDLGKKIQDGNFRQDLYFRLNVLNIRLPALRERGSDIHLLAEHFLVRSTSPPESLSASAAKLLLEHSWPGNVRELENFIRSSSLAVRGAVIDARDLQMAVTESPAKNQIEDLLELDFHSAVSQFEKLLLTKALENAHGNRAEAARLLNIHRQLLYAKLKEHGMSGLE